MGQVLNEYYHLLIGFIEKSEGSLAETGPPQPQLRQKSECCWDCWDSGSSGVLLSFLSSCYDSLASLSLFQSHFGLIQVSQGGREKEEKKNVGKATMKKLKKKQNK